MFNNCNIKHRHLDDYLITIPLEMFFMPANLFLQFGFPDYKKVFPDLQGKRPLSLLEKYPTVQDVLSPENKQDMIQMIKENSHKSYSYAEAKYEKLLQAAEKSIEVCIVNLSSI